MEALHQQILGDSGFESWDFQVMGLEVMGFWRIGVVSIYGRAVCRMIDLLTCYRHRDCAPGRRWF